MKSLLSFFISDTGAVFAFLVQRVDGEEQIQTFKLNATLAEINRVIQNMRKTIAGLIHDPNGLTVDTINQINMGDFDLLGQQILTQALQEALSNTKSLYIVPFGSLHYLPIHAMPFKDKRLIDYMPTAYLPAASLLPLLVSSSSDRPMSGRFLGVGVDAYERDGAFRRELNKIRETGLWDKSHCTLLKGENATRERVLEGVASYDVIHFSTHGFFSEINPMDSGVLLYSEKENGMGSDYPENILTANDLQGQSLSAELIVMSACVTGQSENHPGDELMGLSRSIIMAGAKSMILSLFPIFKAVTVHPDTHFGYFYEDWRKKGMTKSLAFQRYIQRIKQHHLFSHPFFWFSFIYIGALDE